MTGDNKKKTKNVGSKVQTTTGTANAADSGIREYEGRYSDEVNKRLRDAIDRKPFNYNVNEDKLFSQYKSAYENSGKRAMQDTMGDAAALSGGYANSYAVTAGQQAYNSYMEKLSDKVTELEQLAYKRYRDDEDAAYRRLNALLDMENTDYGRYRDSVSDLRDKRDFDYRVSQDSIAQGNKDREYNRSVYENDRDFDYRVSQDDRAQSNKDREYYRSVYEDERDYNRSVYEDDRNYNRSVYEDTRDYEYRKRYNEQKNQDKSGDKFNPEDAYAFLNKYQNAIYTDEEYLMSLYQMYGDKEGFFDWIKTTKIPGDVKGRNYYDLLCEIFPTFLPSNKKKNEQKQREKPVSGGQNGSPTDIMYKY